MTAVEYHRHGVATVLPLALLLLAFCSSHLRAETLPFRDYTIADGLAHDRVNRIVRDSRGFLWFCTSEGLSRFDGYEFKNYTQDHGLPHRTVTDFVETRAGERWIGTGDGLVMFDPLGVQSSNEFSDGAGPTFQTFRPESAAGRRWFVRDLLEDSRGNLLVAAGDGLYRLETTAAGRRLVRVDEPGWNLRSAEISALSEGADGTLWIGTESGLYTLTAGGTFAVVHPTVRVGAIRHDRAGSVWVGTAGAEIKGLFQYVSTAAGPRLVKIYGRADGLSNDYWMNAVIETTDGKIYVGVGDGFCEFLPHGDKHGMSFRQLSGHAAVSLAEDIGGNIWVGTATSGASRLARNGFAVFDKPDGLPSNRIAGITVGPGDKTYALSGGTINRFDDGRMVSVSPPGLSAANWGSNQITFQDHLGEWWVPRYDGLLRYPPVARLEDLPRAAPKKLYTTRDGLFHNSAFKLFEDSRGDVWVGINGDPENSLVKYDRAADRFRQFTKTDGLDVPGHTPLAFAEDARGQIWVAFSGARLFRYRDDKFEDLSARLPPAAGEINDIHRGRDGRLWIAAGSSGVIRVDNADAPAGSAVSAAEPRFTVLSSADGLSSSQATCVTEDDFGRIYIGTGRGVNQLDPGTGRIRVYTTADGLPENVINVCEQDREGGVWFGTLRGLARFVPVAERAAVPPDVFIAGIRANGVSIHRVSELGEASVAGLSLAPDQRQVQIDFLALNFTSGENLRYQYRLGETAPWSEPAAERTVNLNLSPGSYRFFVRAVGPDSAAAEPASVAFTIARPVWQRWWFLAILALATGLAMYGVYRYRLNRLVELEKVRTRIATDLHDDIGSNLSQIAILSEVVRQKIGETGTGVPLGKIADTSREMVDSMSDIVWAINPAKDHLPDLVQRMRRFASDVLEARDIDYRFILGDIPETAGMGSDMRREIYLIFKETVNNLARHSGAATAEIEMKAEGNNFFFRVRDDGIGFVVLEKTNALDRLGGNGLLSMARRAKSLGGVFSIRSAAGEGTTVILTVPLKSGGFFRRLGRFRRSE